VGSTRERTSLQGLPEGHLGEETAGALLRAALSSRGIQAQGWASEIRVLDRGGVRDLRRVVGGLEARTPLLLGRLQTTSSEPASV
jgi:hypothetical protein